MRALVAEGRARALDVGKAFWNGAATAAARKQAQRGLFSRMRKPVDGLVSRTINRRISLAITGLFIDTSMTPNQMTIVANIIGAFGVYFTWQGTWGTLALGAFLVQMQSVLDGCDGEIARLKFQSSRMGEWLDNVLDDTVNVLYGLALGRRVEQAARQPGLHLAGDHQRRLLHVLQRGALHPARAGPPHGQSVRVQVVVPDRAGRPGRARWPAPASATGSSGSCAISRAVTSSCSRS